MKTIALQRDRVNVEALDAALLIGLGAAYLGLSRRANLVRVHLAQEAPGTLVRKAQRIVQEHDPDLLTPRQQRQLAIMRRLQDARRTNPTLLDLSAFADAPELLRRLALKVGWLEQEIRDLRVFYAEDDSAEG